MRLAYAFLADAAEVVNGRFFVFGGGIELVNCPAVPAALPSLAILIKLHLEEDEVERMHALRIAVLDPRGEPCAPDLVANFGPFQVQALPERPLYHSVLASYRGMPLLFFGRYQFLISVDDVLLGDLSLYVDQNPVEGQALVLGGLPPEGH